MADIRKRVGKKGTTYQVRYPSKATKSGYAFKTFTTKKAARAFTETLGTRHLAHAVDSAVRTVPHAIDRWLDVCEKEGRDGRDPVTFYTMKSYRYRAEIMKAHPWEKELSELRTPDVVAFRSWLLQHYSRDQAKKVLSSFHSVLQEMAVRGHIASNVAAGISVRADTRYHAPLTIPTLAEVRALLEAADRLANSKNAQIARSWERYRPMLYLAADSGMRPQEYLALPRDNVLDGGVKVDQALERGDRRISVTKTPSGRRFIDLSPETFDMVVHYADERAAPSAHDLAFPTASGRWQSTDNWRKRGFYAVCIEAGLTQTVELNGRATERPKFKPYDLRHFYASMLIENRVNLKRIQKVMGHSDVSTTLNFYGHLIEREEEKSRQRITMVRNIAEESCGKSAAKTL